MRQPMDHFLLPRQPEPGDNRPRTAFGFLLGFGQAYSAFYATLDAERNRDPRDYCDECGAALSTGSRLTGLCPDCADIAELARMADDDEDTRWPLGEAA